MKNEEWLRKPRGEPSLLELSRGAASHRRSQWAAQTERRAIIYSHGQRVRYIGQISNCGVLVSLAN